MKPFLCILAAATLLLGGCATDQTGTSAEAQRATPARPENRPKPQIGMTKDQIRATYGNPKKVSHTDEGELWLYDNRELAMIPFNFGFTYKTHTFVFGADGLLKRFQVDDF